MNGSTQHMQLPTILLISLFMFSACTGLPHKIKEDSKKVRSSSKAETIISMLKSQNHKLNTLKGVGRITFLENEEKEMTTRIAWAASIPDKVRLTLSSISGHPIISAANDGQWFYFVSHANGDFYKKRPTNFNMRRFFSIAIKSEDIVNILFGRVPMVEYASTDFVENTFLKTQSCKNYEGAEAFTLHNDIKGNENNCVLFLRNKWGNVREKIFLNDRQDAYKIEMFDSSGELVYRVELLRMQDVKSYRVPNRLKVSNDHGKGFQLDLDRYWVNAAISPSVFTLTPPN